MQIANYKLHCFLFITIKSFSSVFNLGTTVMIQFSTRGANLLLVAQGTMIIEEGALIRDECFFDTVTENYVKHKLVILIRLTRAMCYAATESFCNSKVCDTCFQSGLIRGNLWRLHRENVLLLWRGSVGAPRICCYHANRARYLV